MKLNDKDNNKIKNMQKNRPNTAKGVGLNLNNNNNSSNISMAYK